MCGTSQRSPVSVSRSVNRWLWYSINMDTILNSLLILSIAVATPLAFYFLSDKKIMKNLLSSRKLIVILIGTVVLFLVAILYLKNYRLNYCQTKFGVSYRRERCVNQPLYKFIFWNRLCFLMITDYFPLSFYMDTIFNFILGLSVALALPLGFTFLILW